MDLKYFLGELGSSSASSTQAIELRRESTLKDPVMYAQEGVMPGMSTTEGVALDMSAPQTIQRHPQFYIPRNLPQTPVSRLEDFVQTEPDARGPREQQQVNHEFSRQKENHETDPALDAQATNSRILRKRKMTVNNSMEPMAKNARLQEYTAKEDLSSPSIEHFARPLEPQREVKIKPSHPTVQSVPDTNIQADLVSPAAVRAQLRLHRRRKMLAQNPWVKRYKPKIAIKKNTKVSIGNNVRIWQERVNKDLPQHQEFSIEGSSSEDDSRPLKQSNEIQTTPSQVFRRLRSSREELSKEEYSMPLGTKKVIKKDWGQQLVSLNLDYSSDEELTRSLERQRENLYEIFIHNDALPRLRGGRQCNAKKKSKPKPKKPRAKPKKQKMSCKKKTTMPIRKRAPIRRVTARKAQVNQSMEAECAGQERSWICRWIWPSTTNINKPC